MDRPPLAPVTVGTAAPSLRDNLDNSRGETYREFKGLCVASEDTGAEYAADTPGVD